MPRTMALALELEIRSTSTNLLLIIIFGVHYYDCLREGIIFQISGGRIQECMTAIFASTCFIVEAAQNKNAAREQGIWKVFFAIKYRLFLFDHFFSICVDELKLSNLGFFWGHKSFLIFGVLWHLTV